jgi:DNA repair protein RadC
VTLHTVCLPAASAELERAPAAREGPRERLERSGAEALSDAELLALVLGTGHRAGGDAVAIATALLARFGSTQRVVVASAAELGDIPGVGRARAATLTALGELSRRLAATRLVRGAQIRSPRDVHAHFGPLLAAEKKERFYAILLDSKNRVLGNLRISEGSLGASLVHPREAFRPAIRESAAAVIFLHNHPSGDPLPSAEDRQITGRLREAGELLGIPMLDHVIVGAEEYYSFADAG